MDEQHRYLMIHAHNSFSELGHLSDRNTTRHVLALPSLNKIHHRVQHFKALLRNALEDYCKIGHFALSYNLPDHIIEDIGRFICLELLGSSTNERIIVEIREVCHSTAQNYNSALEMLLSAVDMNIWNRRK